MQPFVNPYLFSNPYFSNGLNNGMQPIPNNYNQPQQIGLSGKYVNDFSEITASDIPMNGPAIFAKNDRSEIQLREWNPNGQIITTSYKAVIDNPIVEEQPKTEYFSKAEILEPILAKLSEFEEQLAKLKPTASKATKGASE